MLAKISQKCLAAANMKTLLLSALLFGLSLYAFTPISAEFAAVTQGYLPLDLQFPLTVEVIFQQLPAYSAASKHWYQIFAVADFIFPPLASLFVLMVWGVIINHYRSPLLISLCDRGWLLLPMISALLDWLENIALLYVVHVAPEVEAYAVANVAVFLRSLKLISLAGLAGLTLVIAVLSMNEKYRLWHH